VTWAAPASTGGSAITDYLVKYSSNGGSTWTNFVHPVSTVPSLTITGLTNGTAYVIKVIAMNAVGISLPSANSAPATPATVPGGHDHGTMPTPITPTNGDLWKEQFFAPYVDMGQYPVPDLDGLAKKYGVGLLTLGFMQASPSGKLAWAGYDVLTLDSSNEQAVAIRNEINALRLVGGDVMVSLGGAAGQSLAQSYAQRGLAAPALAMAYAEMVDTLKLNKVDFDIEGVAVAQPQILKLQMDAIAIVQMSRPSLGVWLTLPVLPQGLTQDGVNAVRIALTSGVKVDGVNVMAMDYGDSAAPPALKSMGEYAIDAANATFAQMTTLFTSQGQTFGWNQLGVTPMLGVNDVTSEVFTLQDADRLETFARAKGLGMLSMWSINRDNPGPAGQLSNFHTGIASMPAGGFSLAWGDYGSDPVIVGAVTPVTPTPTPTPTLPTLSVSSNRTNEGNTGTALRQFMVTLSAASMQSVSVQYATADGTAKAGSDYTSASGSLTFAPGELTKTISVAVTGDTTVESDETFVVKLSTALGATILTGTGTGTILNDDTATAGGVALTYTQTSSWATGFNGDMKIKNTGTTAINGWTMEFDMNANIVNIWNAVIVSHVGTRYVIKNADWNGTIAAGAEVSFGFQADGVVGELPLQKKFNGVAV
jgi:chitinase